MIASGDSLAAISGMTGALDGDGGPYVCTIQFLTSGGVQSRAWGGIAPPGSQFVGLTELHLHCSGWRSYCWLLGQIR